jgi:hypothetical protein
MKKYLWLLSVPLFLMILGCGKERLADIATPEEMENKNLLIILPSIPEEFCYADRMTEILDDLSAEFNGTDPQVLSVSESVDCSDYGFFNCLTVDLGTGKNNKHTGAIECISDDQQHLCFYLLGNEYKDAEGNTFESTCIQGMNGSSK